MKKGENMKEVLISLLLISGCSLLRSNTQNNIISCYDTCNNDSSVEMRVVEKNKNIFECTCK